MNAFGFDDFQYVLSTRAKQAIVPKPTRSPKPQFATRSSAIELPHEVDEGGGAFYGPKLDINVRDALGRPWQLGTVQVDFVLPARFDLKVPGSGRSGPSAGDDPSRTRRLAGTFLRYLGRALRRRIPRLAGAPTGRSYADFSGSTQLCARSCELDLKRAGFRVAVDETNEKLGYKIRHWKTQKVPYILVAGKQEIADGTVNVNQRGVDEKRTMLVESFVEELHRVVEAKQ